MARGDGGRGRWLLVWGAGDGAGDIYISICLVFLDFCYIARIREIGSPWRGHAFPRRGGEGAWEDGGRGRWLLVWGDGAGDGAGDIYISICLVFLDFCYIARIREIGSPWRGHAFPRRGGEGAWGTAGEDGGCWSGVLVMVLVIYIYLFASYFWTFAI